MTPEQEAARAKYTQDLKDWRIGLPMTKVEEARKLFDDAGISVHIVKFSPARWSDEEIDYAFNAAKAMGAKGVCDEISEDAVKKLARSQRNMECTLYSTITCSSQQKVSATIFPGCFSCSYDEF